MALGFPSPGSFLVGWAIVLAFSWPGPGYATAYVVSYQAYGPARWKALPSIMPDDSLNGQGSRLAQRLFVDVAASESCALPVDPRSPRWPDPSPERGLSFSTDGKVLGFFGGGGHAVYWDTRTWRPLCGYESPHEAPKVTVPKLAGPRLDGCGPSELTDTHPRALGGDVKKGCAPGFRAQLGDGRGHVCISSDGDLEFRSKDTVRALSAFKVPDLAEDAVCAALSPDRQLAVFSAVNREVVVVDVKSGRVRSPQPSLGGVVHLSYDRGGRRFVVQHQERLRGFDVTSGPRLRLDVEWSSGPVLVGDGRIYFERNFGYAPHWARLPWTRGAKLIRGKLLARPPKYRSCAYLHPHRNSRLHRAIPPLVRRSSSAVVRSPFIWAAPWDDMNLDSGWQRRWGDAAPDGRLVVASWSPTKLLNDCERLPAHIISVSAFRPGFGTTLTSTRAALRPWVRLMNGGAGDSVIVVWPGRRPLIERVALDGRPLGRWRFGGDEDDAIQDVLSVGQDRLLVLANGQLRLWSLVPNAERARAVSLPGDLPSRRNVEQVVLHPGGDLLAVRSSGTAAKVELFSLRCGHMGSVALGAPHLPTAMAFSSRRSELAVGTQLGAVARFRFETTVGAAASACY